MTFLFAAYACFVGAIIGSFLNVVIYRYPREESVVFPPSHCPHCNARIKWYDNVPVFAWLWLRAKCRNCRGPISIRYPLIELANALFYLAIFFRTGVSVTFVPIAALVSMTIVLIYIDLDIQILPDVIDLPGIAIGVAMAALHVGDFVPSLVLAHDWLDSLGGAALGAAVLLAIGMLYKLLRKTEGMGLGDVKMLAMIGAVVGWEPLLPLLFLASCSGALVGIIFLIRDRAGLRFALPFGIFLGLSFLVVLFFGHTLFAWYLALLIR